MPPPIPADQAFIGDRRGRRRYEQGQIQGGRTERSRSCRCAKAFSSSRPTTTSATAPPACSLRSRSPPGRSPPTLGGVMFVTANGRSASPIPSRTRACESFVQRWAGRLSGRCGGFHRWRHGSESPWQSASSTSSRSVWVRRVLTRWGRCARRRASSRNLASGCRPSPACASTCMDRSRPPVAGTARSARFCWDWQGSRPRPWTRRPVANGSRQSTAASRCCLPVSPRSPSPPRTSACIRPRSRTGTPTRCGSRSTSLTAGPMRRCTTRSAADSSCATASHPSRPPRCRGGSPPVTSC